jgi:D-sedoheptulose 7-phosphate isomerase
MAVFKAEIPPYRELLELCDYLLEVPSHHTPKIQEGHLVLGHILCGLVERALFTAPT